MTAPQPPVRPGYVDALENVATSIVAELLRTGQAPDVALDPEEAKREVQRIVREHADSIAALSVGSAFDVLDARLADRYDRNAYASYLHQLSNDLLLDEIRRTGAAIQDVGQARAARVELLREFAGVSAIVVRGVLGAVIAQGAGQLAGSI